MNEHHFGYYLFYFSIFQKFILVRKNMEKISSKYLLVNLGKYFYEIHVDIKGTLVKILHVIIRQKKKNDLG